MVLITGGLIDSLENRFHDAYQELGSIGAAQVQAAFDADQWTSLNVVRLVACGIAFCSLLWALVAAGRATATDDRPQIAEATSV